MLSQKHHGACEAGLASLEHPLFFPTRLGCGGLEGKVERAPESQVNRAGKGRKAVQACKGLGGLYHRSWAPLGAARRA